MAKQNPSLPFFPEKLIAEQKTHGGKNYLCRPIFKLAPKDYFGFIDVYGGGGSMTYNCRRLPDGQQIFNDKNWFRFITKMMVKNHPAVLQNRLEDLAYDEDTFIQHRDCYFRYKAMVEEDRHPNPMDAAVAFLVANKMSREGQCQSFAWSDRKRGGQPGDVNAWQTMVERIPLLSCRLQPVDIQNRLAIDLLDQYKKLTARKWLVYLDPPYVHHTRTDRAAYAEDEMSIEDHQKLAEMLVGYPHFVMLSGYNCDEYAAWFKGWRRVDFNMANHASQEKVKERRIECVWMNFG